MPLDLPSLRRTLSDLSAFTLSGGVRLRSYQRAVAEAVLASIFLQQGRSIVVQFPRQSGKNELQAQLEAYLLMLFSHAPAEVVKVSPTWKPQTINAMRRLERVLEKNVLTRGRWQKESGYIYRIKDARVVFLSGSPTTNIVGATASHLLQVDEAQDVRTDKFDKDIAPMAASTNATRLFWGTAWTSRTLLARELRAAREAEQADGLQRVFILTAEQVAAEVPAYGDFVGGQIHRLGRQHPMVRTQFFGEEIDAQGGMFPPERRALMLGGHERRSAPQEGRLYALLLDVAGEDEASVLDGLTGLESSSRDATALTVVEIDRSQISLLRLPTYRVVDRRLWTGARHIDLYGVLLAMAEHWHAARLVVDATGIGAGLASFLGRALPGRVLPFVFSQASKSKLGWDFLSVIESGRFRDWKAGPAGAQDERSQFWTQVEHCTFEVIPGPERRVRWGVPDGTRDSASGALVHDDLLIYAALCALLDGQVWDGEARSEVVPGIDPLEGLGW
jgi:hypothetical protein